MLFFLFTSRVGLLAFGNRILAPSALNPTLVPQTKIPAPLAPQTQNPRTATAINQSSNQPTNQPLQPTNQPINQINIVYWGQASN